MAIKLQLEFQQIDNRVQVFYRVKALPGEVDGPWRDAGKSRVHHDNQPIPKSSELFNVGIDIFGPGRQIEIEVVIFNVPFGDSRPGDNPYGVKFDVLRDGKRIDTREKRGKSGQVTKETEVDRFKFAVAV